MDAHRTLVRQFRQVVFLASLVCAFSTIHAIQYYSQLDHDSDMDESDQDDTGNNNEDMDDTDNNNEDINDTDNNNEYHNLQSTCYSDYTSIHDTSNPADTSSNSGKANGRWTDQEISLLLDYIEENCSLHTPRGLNLKKSQFNKARDTVKSKDASQCHYKWGHLCGIYKAISLWDKKSGGGWHNDYGANARSAAERQVLDEWLKTPDHAPLRPFATKSWPYYRRMQALMPEAQPRGTHAFNPASSSCLSATQELNLNKVNAEDDGEEDQAGPPVDTLMANMPASLFPPTSDTVPLGGTSSSQSDAMPLPMTSSISPTTHPDHTAINSVLPQSTSTSETPTTTGSTVSKRKRKHDATGDIPTSSKRVLRNKTKH